MTEIPFLDVRSGGPTMHARARVHVAEALRDACLGAVKPISRLGLSTIDRIATNWLRRSGSAYRDELEHIVGILDFPGAMALNMCYLFACTTQAYEDDNGAPRIRRTLDWPFHGLGRTCEIAWQAGPAGDFYNATWPGAVGVLSATAPGRFCAVINQAPMQRRMRGMFGFPFDAAVNIRNALKSEGDWLPDHLLRYAFENCESFEDAIALLANAPLVRPALFTLAGARRGEIALVEHRGRGARILRGPVIVANDWQEPQPGWQARMSTEDNIQRKAAMEKVRPDAARFSWVAPPVLNPLTRLAVEMTAAGDGELFARGYESRRLWVDMPTPATQDFQLCAATPMAFAA